MRFGIREIIFLIVLLAVPVASFVYVFKPRNSEITQAKLEIAIKQERLDQLEEMTAQIEDIGLEIENGKQAIALIEEKLPSEDDVAGMLEQFTQLARSNHLNVPSFKPQPPVPAAAFMELPIEMVMEGRFDDFYEFLLALEKLPRITRIHRLSMEQASMGVGAGRGPGSELPPGSMKAQFTLSIYFASASSVSD
ncbi:MAG: type 4a pilus biogenesis protein PilO [Phycisphaerales bacterium]|nr:MAG: type 4a pilus biogenesis protein PilO [Phycisphaerales bacterium]